LLTFEPLLLFFNDKQHMFRVTSWSNWQEKISNTTCHVDKQRRAPMLKKLRDAKSPLRNLLRD
jgi:hypothetical protein